VFDVKTFLMFIGPCVANIFAEYNQQYTKFLNLFISVRRSTCFEQCFRRSSGALNCMYSVRHLSDHQELKTAHTLQFRAPDDRRKHRSKHVERLTEINKLRNVASCSLYSANTLYSARNAFPLKL